MTTKVLICPYFGVLPSWYEHWERNTERMREHGYDFLFDQDEDDFRQRVREILEIEPPPMTGTGRIWNFRPAFGLLYAKEIEGFDFWGHTDFDCVYGRVERWYTDEYLSDLDITSNHVDYISGPWTLYRNSPVINSLFLQTDEWEERMSGEDSSHGWAEKGFTEIVDGFHRSGLIRRDYMLAQTRNWDDFSTLRLEGDGRLMEGGTEVCLAHFRRTKVYPPGCVLQ